jgi:aminoglycoside 3-N-acetyltransferase
LRLDRLKRGTKRAVSRLWHSVSLGETRRALREVMGEGADVLLVHSALSGCGYFTAGPEDVVAALRDFAETLCLPTHTYCYPSGRGRLGPIFDPAATPSKNGVLTEIFRKQPDVLRSINATHSIAAAGALARDLTTDHDLLDAPCGQGSPWDRLVRRGASVLLFGTSFHAYTPYHTAEDAAGSPFAYEPGTIDRLRYRGTDGAVHERRSRRQSWAPRRFREAGDLLERTGLVRRVVLGHGHLLFVPDSAKVHDFLVERLRRIPDFLIYNCDASLS